MLSGGRDKRDRDRGDDDPTLTFDVERLARAILRAAHEEDRRPITGPFAGFEWYGSALEMARGIVADYAQAEQ